MNARHDEDEINQAIDGSRAISDKLRQCVAHLDWEHLSYGELMSGIMFFAMEGMSWCHRHMESHPGTLELVIAQFSDGLRATVAEAMKQQATHEAGRCVPMLCPMCREATR